MLHSNILKTYREEKIFVELYYFFDFSDENEVEIHRVFDNYDDATEYKEQVGESYNFSTTKVPITFMVHKEEDA